jgi:2-hydroxymuconate-semialdehyde hydrolase
MDRAASFARTARRLRDLDVVTYDRRGYAGSLGGGVAPGITAHAEDLQRVLDWCGSDVVAVVGHSLGGTIALALAAAGDDRLGGLGAYESPAPWLDDSRSRVGGGAVEVGRRDGPAAAAEHFYRLMVGDRTWERLRRRDRDARRAEGPALLAELEDLRDEDTSVELREVRRHVVVGVGADSPAHLRSGSVELARWLPDAELRELPGADHGVHLTRPDEFARFVRDVTLG